MLLFICRLIEQHHSKKDFIMRIYVGTFKKYNEGSLYGKWLNLYDYVDHDDFIEDCKALHADEADPEFHFQDWEDLPEGTVTECTVDEALWDFMYLDGNEQTIVIAWMDGTNDSLSVALGRALENHIGEYKDEAEYGRISFKEQFDESIQNSLFCYIDFDRYGRDMMEGLLYSNGHLFTY